MSKRRNLPKHRQGLPQEGECMGVYYRRYTEYHPNGTSQIRKAMDRDWAKQRGLDRRNGI